MDQKGTNNQPLLFRVEKEISELLLAKMEHLEVSLDRASKIAKFVLHVLPEGLSDEQIQQIIPKLDDEFFELSEIVNEHIKEYEEKYGPVIMEKVHELTRHRDFDEASRLMKEYLERVTNKVIGKPIQK